MQIHKTYFLVVTFVSMSAAAHTEVQPISDVDAKQIVHSFAHVYKSEALADEAQACFDASYENHAKYIRFMLQSIHLEKKQLEQLNYALMLLDQVASRAPQAYKEGMILSKKFNQLVQDFSASNRSQEEMAYASQQLLEDSQFNTFKEFQTLVQELASFVEPLIQEIQEFMAQFNTQEFSEEQQEQIVQATNNLVKMIKPNLILLQSTLNEVLRAN